MGSVRPVAGRGTRGPLSNQPVRAPPLASTMWYSTRTIRRRRLVVRRVPMVVSVTRSTVATAVRAATANRSSRHAAYVESRNTAAVAISTPRAKVLSSSRTGTHSTTTAGTLMTNDQFNATTKARRHEGRHEDNSDSQFFLVASFVSSRLRGSLPDLGEDGASLAARLGSRSRARQRVLFQHCAHPQRLTKDQHGDQRRAGVRKDVVEGDGEDDEGRPASFVGGAD